MQDYSNSARINLEVVMMYKTNPLETEWRGFKAPNSTKEHRIQICKIFKQTPLHMIVPEPISQNITKIIISFIPIIKYYNSLDSTFWHHLYQDSTHYLHSNDLFPGESKLYNYAKGLITSKIKIF